MKFFKTSRGIVVSFGFDVWNRKPDPRRIHWSDILGVKWEPAGNSAADFATFPFDVLPEFIHETVDRTLVAYLPGKCIEMLPDDGPHVWRIRVLAPEPIASVMAGGDPMWPASNVISSPLSAPAP
jgi:hypothetical protein